MTTIWPSTDSTDPEAIIDRCDFATKQGVTHFAALGNDSDDRAHPTIDVISPDFPPGEEEEREITNACVVIPLEVNGVVGVSAVGSTRQTDDDDDDDPNDYLKSFYSAYGVGVTEVTAPAGYSVFFTPESVSGRVLSTYPPEAPYPAARGRGDPDGRVLLPAGTSMASPHAAGVAALLGSRFGTSTTRRTGRCGPGAWPPTSSRRRTPSRARPCFRPPTRTSPGPMGRRRSARAARGTRRGTATAR